MPPQVRVNVAERQGGNAAAVACEGFILEARRANTGSEWHFASLYQARPAAVSVPPSVREGMRVVKLAAEPTGEIYSTKGMAPGAGADPVGASRQARIFSCTLDLPTTLAEVREPLEVRLAAVCSNMKQSEWSAPEALRPGPADSISAPAAEAALLSRTSIAPAFPRDPQPPRMQLNLPSPDGFPPPFAGLEADRPAELDRERERQQRRLFAPPPDRSPRPSPDRARPPPSHYAPAARQHDQAQSWRRPPAPPAPPPPYADRFHPLGASPPQPHLQQNRSFPVASPRAAAPFAQHPRFQHYHPPPQRRQGYAIGDHRPAPPHAGSPGARRRGAARRGVPSTNALPSQHPAPVETTLPQRMSYPVGGGDPSAARQGLALPAFDGGAWSPPAGAAPPGFPHLQAGRFGASAAQGFGSMAPGDPCARRRPDAPPFREQAAYGSWRGAAEPPGAPSWRTSAGRQPWPGRSAAPPPVQVPHGGGPAARPAGAGGRGFRAQESPVSVAQVEEALERLRAEKATILNARNTMRQLPPNMRSIAVDAASDTLKTVFTALGTVEKQLQRAAPAGHGATHVPASLQRAVKQSCAGAVDGPLEEVLCELLAAIGRAEERP